MAAGHGGQVLLSVSAAGLAAESLPAGAELRDLGEHRLKDLFQPEHLFQLVYPGLDTDFPPLTTLSRRPNNLPTQASAFLGRDLQLGEIRHLLDNPSVRLLTLIGPGGIGKTRLALQAAADQIDRFEDGVYFVDLAPLREPGAVFEAIERALNLVETSGEQPIDVVRTYLAERHLLLLLDNLEHVIDAAGGIGELLQRCSKLKVLVTSREALRLRGERLYPVPPLSVPNGHEPRSAEIVAGYESVRLFVERAREVRPAFALTEQNAAAVADICAQLDGLPLAIELAAARLRLFSPEDLRDRLRSRLELLRGGPRDLPDRQRTLRDTIAWSYDLLNDDEQAVFRLLSTFTSTGVEQVENVVERCEPLRHIDVVDGLSSLIDKSLVRSVETDGRQRLSMLETIRDYAVERLNEEPTVADAVRRAHAEHFAAFAQSQRIHLIGADRKQALDDLALERGNLSIAWRYWIDADDFENLNRILDSLWVLYEARGWYQALNGLTGDLLGVLSTAPDTPNRAEEEITLLTSLARGLMAVRGYTKEAEESFLRARAMSERAGVLPQQFSVLRSLAFFYLYRGDFDQIEPLGQQMLALAQQENDIGMQVEGHMVIGSGLSFTGQFAAGLAHLDRAITLFDPQQGSGRFRLGPSAGVTAGTTAAFMHWLMGYPDRAVERASEALRRAEQLEHPFTLAYALYHVGYLDLWRGEMDLLFERATALIDVTRDHDYPIWKAVGSLLFGIALISEGQLDEGLVHADRGVALYEGLTTPAIFWPLILYTRARGFGMAGRPTEGIALIDQAIEMMGQGFMRSEFELTKGDLLLDRHDPSGAELLFRSALDTAMNAGLRMSQLRAAIRIVQVSQTSGIESRDIETLRSIYATFNEGFNEPDLVAAQQLLDATQGS